MRFKYSYLDNIRNELRRMPLLPLTLGYGHREIDVVGLVDSGAMINMLPYSVGLELGAVWNDAEATLSLGKVYAGMSAIPLPVTAQVGEFDPRVLMFGWAENDNVRIILGQANFFQEFDVCFYRSILEFEINPKSTKYSGT